MFQFDFPQTLNLSAHEDSDLVNIFVCSVCDIHSFFQSAPKGHLQLNLVKVLITLFSCHQLNFFLIDLFPTYSRSMQLVHSVVTNHTEQLSSISIHRILSLALASRVEDSKDKMSAELLVRLLVVSPVNCVIFNYFFSSLVSFFNFCSGCSATNAMFHKFVHLQSLHHPQHPLALQWSSLPK